MTMESDRVGGALSVEPPHCAESESLPSRAWEVNLDESLTQPCLGTEVALGERGGRSRNLGGGGSPVAAVYRDAATCVLWLP